MFLEEMFWLAAIIGIPLGIIIFASNAERKRTQEKFDAEFAHLPHGERIIKVAQAMDAAKKLS